MQSSCESCCSRREGAGATGVDAGKLAQLQGGTAYRVLPQGLNLLRAIWHSSWPVIVGKSAVTREDLRAASLVAPGLPSVPWSRARAAPTANVATDQRHRAFTLFVQAYEDARAAITYLRRDYWTQIPLRHRCLGQASPGGAFGQPVGVLFATRSAAVLQCDCLTRRQNVASCARTAT